jgi:hypothetical protein
VGDTAATAAAGVNMAQTANMATTLLASLLRGDDGINAAAGSLQLDRAVPLIADHSIVEMQAAPDITEKSGSVKYPAIHVYCDRIANTLAEKFRRFSGTADLNIEIRVSHDRMEELQDQLRTYVAAVTNILEGNRGAWDSQTWYPGRYDVKFNPVRHGGRNYLQTASVQLQVHIQSE